MNRNFERNLPDFSITFRLKQSLIFFMGCCYCPPPVFPDRKGFSAPCFSVQKTVLSWDAFELRQYTFSFSSPLRTRRAPLAMASISNSPGITFTGARKATRS